MLSCSCQEFELEEPGQWFYYVPNDFSIFNAKRRKRCSSCKELINVGLPCLRFDRERLPYTEIEESISGDLISISPFYLCEKCGEIYLNLDAAGYCLDPQDNMPEALKEYWKITGFKPYK